MKTTYLLFYRTESGVLLPLMIIENEGEQAIKERAEKLGAKYSIINVEE